MQKTIFLSLLITLMYNVSFAQPQTKEQLERQRQELRKEIEATEKLLNQNKAKTKENLLQWRLISKKVALQNKVVDNINKELKGLNNNLYTIQKDVNRYDRLLDTLKKEYAKSMVYAYKNRSSYDFLNFIFASESFNDAVKRITYLKSYRNYREMQGENILRTQELRKKRIADLSSTRKVKANTLQSQSTELKTLASEQQEKDRILAELKKQGKDLNKQIAAKQKQVKKVNSAIAAAIKKAQDDARKEALAKAEREERARKAAEKTAEPTGSPTTPVKSVAAKPAAPKKAAESVLLNAENVALNENFERNKGSLPWPVDRGTVLMHYGNNKLPSGSDYVITNITISSDIGTPVKSVFNGTVTRIVQIEDMQVVIVQHGRYFTTYSNLSGVTVKAGQEVTTGQTLGRVAPNFEGIGAIDFFMSNEKSNFDPESWLRRR